MEVKIGMKHVARELVLESSQSPDQVAETVNDAIKSEAALLTLVDDKGRRVLISVDSLAYVEIAEPESRRVGFGTV